MAREKGVASFSAAYEPQSALPLDARMLVGLKADLVTDATWRANDGNIYIFVGMIVSVAKETNELDNGIYRLAKLPFTYPANWERIGGGVTALATTTTPGLMSAADKIKLDALQVAYYEAAIENATTTLVVHSLNREPSVRVIGTDNEEYGVHVKYIDKNTLRVISNIAITGKIICA